VQKLLMIIAKIVLIFSTRLLHTNYQTLKFLHEIKATIGLEYFTFLHAADTVWANKSHFRNNN